MNLTALPAFSDNYIWMFDDGRHAVVVDPGEAGPVLAALEARRLELAAILVTHHHADHVGGVDALRSRLRGEVYGPTREHIPEPCQKVAGGDRLQVFGVDFEVLDVPGHTSGHIAWFTPDLDRGAAAHGAPVVFSGDTLFSGGCGRLFEGTPAQMWQSLSRLSALPADTRVCCGHEYTLANLRFASAVEPANADIEAYTDWCRSERAAGRPTLPSSIGRERQVNPFLRCTDSTVIDSARRHGAPANDPVTVLAALRQWKNDFR